MMLSRVPFGLAINDRRQRIHDLVLAGDGTGLPSGDPGNWIERNCRVVRRYQDLVRSSVTLDDLVDQEVHGRFKPTP